MDIIRTFNTVIIQVSLDADGGLDDLLASPPRARLFIHLCTESGPPCLPSELHLIIRVEGSRLPFMLMAI